MKRRIWTILSVAIILVFCCAFAVACDKQQKKSNEILIADFETYEELTEMRWLNHFGSAELSDDHVARGNKSIHVSIMGNPNMAAKPVICIDTKTARVEKYDFTDVDRFALDVYNDNDYDANVYFQYLTAAENQNKPSSEIKAVVKAKTAQTVEFVVDRALCSYFLNLDDVLQLRVAFDPIEEYGQEYRSFYIDNLRCYTTSEKYTAVNPRGEDEIESADRPEYMAAWGNILPYVYSPSSLTFNSDPAYIKAGDGSFKLTSELTGGNGDLYTIGIACINNPIADFSQYAALGYWVYNPNDIVIRAWLTGNYYMGELQPHEWTYFEVTQAMFKEAQGGNSEADDVNSLENFGPMFQVPNDKSYSLYIDEMYAIKDGTEPVITVEEFEDTYPEKGSTIPVPKASVKYADGYTVSVYAPNDDLIGENIESFVADKYGFYEIVYKATARRADENGNYAEAEERIKIAVGTIPEFKTLPENIFLSGTDEYSFVPPEAENGTVKWKAEVIEAYYPASSLLGKVREVDTDGYRQGVKEGTGGGVVKVYEGTAVRITYTAVNEEHGLSAVAVQTVLLSADERRLAEKYPDMYTEGSAGGDLSIITGAENILGESGGLRLQNALGDASGVFTPSQDLYLGTSNENLRFIVYNNGSKPVSFLVNGNGQPSIGEENVVLAPGSYLIFNGVMYGYEAALQGWKIVSEDKYLLPLTFTATSEAAVDLYIGRFTVNENSFAPQVNVGDFGKVQSGTPIELKDYITVSGMEETFSYTISYSTAENGSFNEVARGNSSETTEYTPDKAGWYIVEYRVEYAEGEVTSSKKFQAVGRELVFKNVPVDTFAPVGEYKITPPVSEQGTVTWKAEVYESFFPGEYGKLRTDINANGYTNGVKTGTGNDTVYVYGDLAVRITYTVTDSEDAGNTASVYQTVINFTDSERLSESYADFYTGATLSGALTLLTEAEKVFGDGGFRLSGDAAQSSGGYSATGTFTPAESAKYLGISNTNLRFVVYNSGSAAVTLSGNRFSGNTVTIAPQMSAVFNGGRFGYDAALVGWGLIEGGNLNSMEFTATSNSPIDLRIGCFTVNENSFAPKVSVDDFGEVQSGTPIELKDYITVSGMEEIFSYTISYSAAENGSFEETARGNSDGVTTYTPDKAGWYIVEYRVEYDGDAITVSKKFQAVGRELVLTNIPEDVFAAAGEYTITPPVSEQGTVTWKAELFEIFFLAGSCGNLRTDISSNGYVNGVKTGTGSGTVYVFENHAVRITYTVTDSLDQANTLNVYQTVINFTDSERLSESYKDFYTGATLSGALTLLTEAEKVFGDGGFRLSGDTVQSSGGYSATGTFTPAESAKYLGISNTNLRFVVYNSGSAAVTLSGNRFSGNTVTIAPQMSAVFNGGRFGYDAALVGWGLIEGGNLNSMEFTATSNSPIDLRIGCFTVNKDSFVPQVNLNVQESYTAGASVDFAGLISVEGNAGFEYVVRKSDGTQIVSGSSEDHGAVTLSETGEYEVVYTVNYNKGAQPAQKTVTATFTVNAFTVDLGNESVKHILAGSYKLGDNLPALQDGQRITAWTVQRYHVHILYGDLKPVELAVSSAPDYAIVDKNGCIIEFLALEDYAYKVVYTISDGVNVASVTQWLLPETGSRLEETHSESFAAGHYGAEPGTSVEIGAEHIATDKAIVATGSKAVGFNFRPQADLGDNLSALTFWIMIESDSADTVHLNLGKNGTEWGGKDVPTPTGVWIRANLDLDDILKAWGVVDGENVFQELGIRVTGVGNLTVYVDLFSVHENNS